MAIDTRLTLCNLFFSGVACAAGDLPALGTAPKQPVGKGDPEACQRLQQDFDIDLKEVVKAGCAPSTEQISTLMDNPVGNLLISSRWNFQLSFIPVIPTFMF